MPKQLSLSALVDLPDNVFEASEIVRRVGEPWQKMLTDLADAGVDHTHTSETIESRAKPGSVGRPKGSRTKRASMPATNGSGTTADTEAAP